MGTRGIGHLFLRGDMWWWAIGQGGAKLRMSTGLKGGAPGKPPAEVIKWVARKLTELGQGKSAKAEYVTFDALADALVARYTAEKRSTLSNLVNRLKPLRAYFKDRKAQGITTSDFALYAASRRDKDKAAIATINLELNYAARAFSVAVEDRVLSVAPKIHHLPGQNVRQGVIEAEMFKDIVQRQAEGYRSLSFFLYYTGWRRSEPCSLRWSNVSWEANDLLLTRSKTGEPRRLPFGTYRALFQLLQRQREYCDELQSRLGRIIEWVFPQPDGTATKSEGFYRSWKAAAVLAGYPASMPHDFRRTVARRGEMTRTPQKATMALMGVETAAVFARYAQLTRKDVEDALERMSEAADPESVIRPFRKKQEGGEK